MGYVLSAVARVLEQPTAWGAACEMAVLAGPLWAAALLGLLLGWAWRPRWAAGLVATADSHPAPLTFATLEFWRTQLPARIRAPLAQYVGAAGPAPPPQQEDDSSLLGYVGPRTVRRNASPCSWCWCGGQSRIVEWWIWCAKLERVFDPVGASWFDRSSEMANEQLAVGKDDLMNLWRLVEGRDGGPAWIKMMEKALPAMTYQAWRRDPQVNSTFSGLNSLLLVDLKW